MSTIQKFEDLEIWQLARILSKKIFLLTKTEKLCKEGYGRGSRLEFIQFLSISSGSSDELKSQLYRCMDREYIEPNTFDELYNEIFILHKKINGFMKYLNKTTVRGTKFKERSQ